MTDAVAQHADSPVHTHSAPTSQWSTVNYAEAIQGVQTPLGWTYWDTVMEGRIRRAFGQIGVLSRREIPPPTVRDDRTSGIFYGYAAGNVSFFRKIGDTMPGTTGDTVVEQMFGERRPAVASAPTPRVRLRYPVVAVKLPLASLAHARGLPELRRRVGQWWRTSAVERPPTSVGAATAMLAEAVEWFCRVGTAHATLSMVGQAVAEQVELVAVQGLGSRELAADLMTGYGSFEETEMLSDLCEAAAGRLKLEEFLARHGYHGPDEGAITSRAWREDPTPVHRLVERYRNAEVAHPGRRRRRGWSAGARPRPGCSPASASWVGCAPRSCRGWPGG